MVKYLILIALAGFTFSAKADNLLEYLPGHVAGHNLTDDLKKIEAAAEQNGITVSNLKAPTQRQLAAFSLSALAALAELLSNWALDQPVNCKAYVITGEFNGERKTCFATIINFTDGSSEVTVNSCGKNFVNTVRSDELFSEVRVKLK